MSDYQSPTPPPGEDRVRDTLTALRVDADGCVLREPASVRRRGQARTRHQVAASVCAAVVAVVAVVTGSALLGGQGGAHHRLPPANQPTSSPHALALKADPLLLVGEVGPIGPYEQFQRNPDPVDEQQRPLQCVPSAATLGAAESKAALFYDPAGDATFIEHALRFDKPSGASAAVTVLSSAFASCDKGKANEVTVDDRGPDHAAGTGDDSEVLHASRLSTPKTAGDVGYYELGIARSANVVLVFEWSSMGKPFEDQTSWVWSAEVLDLATRRATT